MNTGPPNTSARCGFQHRLCAVVVIALRSAATTHPWAADILMASLRRFLLYGVYRRKRRCSISKEISHVLVRLHLQHECSEQHQRIEKLSAHYKIRLVALPNYQASCTPWHIMPGPRDKSLPLFFLHLWQEASNSLRHSAPCWAVRSRPRSHGEDSSSEDSTSSDSHSDVALCFAIPRGQASPTDFAPVVSTAAAVTGVFRDRVGINEVVHEQRFVVQTRIQLAARVG